MEVKHLVIAGWTGRDEAALRKHIKELEEIGVKPPKTTPIFYRVSADLMTLASEIQVSGPDTSGEVEFVLLSKPDGLRVTVGSDHTDRKAETIGVSLSKQLCSKPIAKDAWRYEELKPHWEKLVLRAWSDGERIAGGFAFKIPPQTRMGHVLRHARREGRHPAGKGLPHGARRSRAQAQACSRIPYRRPPGRRLIRGQGNN